MDGDNNKLSKVQIVPFGKYKGQPVEVLASDPQYVEWLLSQNSIKTKYPDIINVIINNFQTPSETPEHNAIQVKFLDDDYRVNFAHYYVSEHSGEDFCKVGVSIRSAVSEYIEHSLCRDTSNLSEQAKQELALEQQGKREEMRENIFDNNSGVCFQTGEVYFEEKGLDVTFYAGIDIIDNDSELSKIRKNGSLKYYRDFRQYLIEIKPVVSDDFPAVLRQMKLSKANILFLSKYTGIGAKLEDFVKYFKTQNIIVVFESDIDNFVSENLHHQYYFNI
jgi:hypothetical protein